MTRLTKGQRTRERMIAATAKLLQRKGYHGTGLSQIIKESGTPKGSLYFHFPDGKEELTATALRNAGRDFSAKLEGLLSPETGPAEAIELACATLAEELIKSDFQEGCPLATVALEAASKSEPIRLACVEHFQRWQDRIQTMLMLRGLAPPKANELAVVALAMMEGALILCRVHKTTAPLEKVGKQMHLMLSAVLPEQS